MRRTTKDLARAFLQTATRTPEELLYCYEHDSDTGGPKFTPLQAGKDVDSNFSGLDALSIIEQQGFIIFRDMVTEKQRKDLLHQVLKGTQLIVTGDHRPNLKQEDKDAIRNMDPCAFAAALFDKDHSGRQEFDAVTRYNRSTKDASVPYGATNFQSAKGITQQSGMVDAWGFGATYWPKVYRNLSALFRKRVYWGPERISIKGPDSTLLPPHIDSPIYSSQELDDLKTERAALQPPPAKKQKTSPPVQSVPPVPSSPSPSPPPPAPTSNSSWSFQYMDDNKQWSDFDKDMNDEANKHIQQPNYSKTFTVSGSHGHRYELDFNARTQKNTMTGVIRKFRTFTVSTSSPMPLTAQGVSKSLPISPTSPTSPSYSVTSSHYPLKQPPGTVASLIEFEDEHGNWTPMSAKVCREFNARDPSKPTMKFTHGNFEYKLCLKDLFQVNLETKVRRNVRIFYKADDSGNDKAADAAAGDKDMSSSCIIGNGTIKVLDGTHWISTPMPRDMEDALHAGAYSWRYKRNGDDVTAYFYNGNEVHHGTGKTRPMCIVGVDIDAMKESVKSEVGKYDLPDSVRVEVYVSGRGWLTTRPREASAIYDSYQNGTVTEYNAHEDLNNSDYAYTYDSKHALRFKGHRKDISPKGQNVRVTKNTDLGALDWLYNMRSCYITNEHNDQATALRHPGQTFQIPSNQDLNGFPHSWLKRGVSLTEPSSTFLHPGDYLYDQIEEHVFKKGNLPKGANILTVEECHLPSNLRIHLNEIDRLRKIDPSTPVTMRMLLHGTSERIADTIMKDGNGLDVAYAGKNVGTIYGRGCYAVNLSDPLYAHSPYAEANQDGVRTMFLVHVAMRTFVQGKNDQIAAPDGHGGHHMLVNDTVKPHYYCAIKDCMMCVVARFRYNIV